uniref:Putative seryl-trna synthetase n=1 Tax=Ixodes ricinus TaxID=34613 RepID=A0A0K8R6Y5_IXORI
MVLDLELFRADKGGDPEKIRENQRRRFKDPGLVDKVVDADTVWRKLRHQLDNWNKLKNLCSKEIGQKMKKKEHVGEGDNLPDSVVQGLSELTSEVLQGLTVNQIKRVRVLIDEAIVQCNVDLEKHEGVRNDALREMGNWLHESCVVSNDEEENAVIKTHGDVVTRKKYSHVDLIVMIDGMDGDRGSVTAGGRGGTYLTRMRRRCSVRYARPWPSTPGRRPRLLHCEGRKFPVLPTPQLPSTAQGGRSAGGGRQLLSVCT